MNRTLHFRIILSFSFVIAAFAAGTAFVFWSLARMEEAAEEVNRWEEATRFCLTMATHGRDLYVHEAHWIITRDDDHLEHVKQVSEKMKQCQTMVRTAVRSAEDLACVDAIDEAAGEFRRVLFDGIVPAMRQDEPAEAFKQHERSEALLERIVSLNDELSGRFRKQIGQARRRMRDLSSQAGWAVFASLLLAAGTAVLVGFTLGRSVLVPIRALIEGTQKVARGNLTPDLPSARLQEFAALTESFERMAGDLRDRQKELLAAEKRASLGDLAAGVAHQINNPLSVILGYARLLEDRRLSDPAQAQDAYRIIADEALETKMIVETLLSLACPGQTTVDEVRAADLLESMIQHVGRYREGAQDRILLELSDPELRLGTDRRKLQQALTNLVVNGLESMPQGGTLRIRAAQANGHAVFEVDDEGPGVAPEVAERIFDPYFTTKRNGTGLGLSLTDEIVRTLGGTVAVRNKPARGCVFSVRLPLTPVKDPP